MTISVDERLERLTDEAREIHRSAIIVDGHCDTPFRLKRHAIGIADRDETAHVDLERLVQSGITASFFAAYVPPYYDGRGSAAFADQMIDIVERETARHPSELVLGNDSRSIRRAKEDGRVAILIGIEGGHAIEDSLETLDRFYRRGVRYLTLTHVNTNNWADSSTDAPRHGGLSAFGRDVVRTMNRLGMIVDVSHVADTTFYAALETSSVPVIASHSSCRALTDHPRNLTDPMLRDLAQVGGVCMINFYSAFINQHVANVLRSAPERAGAKKRVGPNEEVPDDRTDWAAFCEWYDSLNCPEATLEDVLDHMVHAAEVAGPGTVGLGDEIRLAPIALDRVPPRDVEQESLHLRLVELHLFGTLRDGERLAASLAPEHQMIRERGAHELAPHLRAAVIRAGARLAAPVGARQVPLFAEFHRSQSIARALGSRRASFAAPPVGALRPRIPHLRTSATSAVDSSSGDPQMTQRSADGARPRALWCPVTPESIAPGSVSTP